ncbi:hypothetical protein P7K49_015779 [Saguinus oedipus]|uniref:C2 domain-containing protein n=1 Tax=Saguinus oedipus TaxID=9490 RepID=A0ABQ9VA75_SAGOE|nr:hypothetical protein P7K49_015779 [Saguinus oedipus]
MSLSGEAEAVQVRGSVHFGLHYEPGAAELRVHVIQCQGLAAARRRRSDPYVKSYLLPDKQSKRKTAVKKRNLNPVFNETLRDPPQPTLAASTRATSSAPLKRASCPQYSVPQAELQGRVLSLSVWHRESLGRNIFLGEAEVPLDTWDWGSEPTWLPLHPRVRSQDARGDLGPGSPAFTTPGSPAAPSDPIFDRASPQPLNFRAPSLRVLGSLGSAPAGPAVSANHLPSRSADPTLLRPLSIGPCSTTSPPLAGPTLSRRPSQPRASLPVPQVRPSWL